jgi:enterochelin esterase-like enzyme
MDMSPRITALHDQVVAGNDAAIDHFWHLIAAEGTPLIESLPGHDDHLLVTFVWRGTGPLQNVVLIDGPASRDLVNNCLDRMPDTDLWYRTYHLRNDARFTYMFGLNDSLIEVAEVSASKWAERTANWVPDPLNLHPFPSTGDPWASAVTLPGAPQSSWTEPTPGTPKGDVESYTIPSTALGQARQVWVYTPPAFRSDAPPYNLLLLSDGQTYTSLIPLPTILDNLIAAGLIPPLIAVMVETAGETRNLELNCYPPFIDFLGIDLIPWIRAQYPVTTNPARTFIAGLSAGGLAAAYAGLQRHDLFGNVLSQSGSFYWAPEGDLEAEWLARQFVCQDRLPVRFYIEVGLMEVGETPAPFGPSMVTVNRHFRDVLMAKGYDVIYTEFNGAHDYFCWSTTFADGLMALMGSRQG